MKEINGISYKFNKKTLILEVIYQGKIYAQDLIEYGKSFSNEKYLPRELNILVDATQADYKVPRNEFPKLIIALKRDLKKFERIRVAFIQTKPKETAYSMLYGQKAILPNYVHRVFSEKQTALDWLKTNKDF
jgi:hypothetical protein